MQNRSSFDKGDSKSIDSQSESNKRILVTLTTHKDNAPLKGLMPCPASFEAISPNGQYKARSDGHRILRISDEDLPIFTLDSAVAIKWNEDNTLVYLQRSQVWIFDPAHFIHTALCNHVDSNKPPAFYFSLADNQFARVIEKNIEVFRYEPGNAFLELKTPADYRKAQEKEIFDDQLPLVKNVKKIVISYMDMPSQLFFSKPDLRVAPCLPRGLKTQVSDFLNLMNDQISSLMVTDQYTVLKLNVITFLMTELNKSKVFSAEIVKKSFQEIAEHPFLSAAAEHPHVKKILDNIGDAAGVETVMIQKPKK